MSEAKLPDPAPGAASDAGPDGTPPRDGEIGWPAPPPARGTELGWPGDLDQGGN